jgi:hypothetical protein
MSRAHDAVQATATVGSKIHGSTKLFSLKSLWVFLFLRAGPSTYKNSHKQVLILSTYKNSHKQVLIFMI